MAFADRSATLAKHLLLICAALSAYCIAEAAKPPSVCPINCAWNDVTSGCSCPEHPTMSGPPILSNPYISDEKTVFDKWGKPFKATKFSFSCTVRYETNKDDGARFEVVFEADGFFVARFIVKSKNPVVELDEMYLWKNGGKRPENDTVMLGRSLVCRATPYWESKNPIYGQPRFSNDYWIGIRPIDDNGLFIPKIVVQSGQTFHFRMISTVPVTTGYCFLISKHNAICDPVYSFFITANKPLQQQRECAFQLSFNVTISLPIVSSSIPSISALQSPFLWQIQFMNYTELRPSPGSINLFQHYKIENIIVEIIQTLPRPMCIAIGDPHFTTFGNNRFDLYQLGDFYLIREPRRFFEIQVRLFRCNGRATCICGVIVREGNNVLGVDVCRRESAEGIPDYSPRLTRILTDVKYPSGIMVATGSGWTITMMSGIKINIDRGGTILNVYVIGLNSDNYTGLCSLITSQHPCDSDCTIWRVPIQVSLFNINSTNYPQCNPPYFKPTCNCDGNNEGRLTLTCSDQDKGIPLLNPGLSCDGNRRRKRSAIIFEDDIPVDIDVLYNILFATYDPDFGRNIDLSWPTHSGITEDEAMQRCNNALKNSTIYSNYVGSDETLTQMIRDCVADIQLSDSLSPADDLPGQLLRHSLYAIESSIVESSSGNNDNTTERLKQQLNDAKSQACPGNCYQRGTCENSTCFCDSGFVGDDCSVIDGEPPTINSILTPSCDLRVKKGVCSRILVTATNILRQNLTCQMRVSDNSSISYDYNTTVSGYVVVCSLPSAPIDSTIYYVSLSNDYQNYSNEIQYKVINGDATTSVIATTSSNNSPPPSPT